MRETYIAKLNQRIVGGRRHFGASSESMTGFQNNSKTKGSSDQALSTLSVLELFSYLVHRVNPVYFFQTANNKLLLNCCS